MPTSNEIIDGGIDCLCVCLSITDSYKMELLRSAINSIVEAAVMEAVEKILGNTTEVRMKEWHPEIKLL